MADIDALVIGSGVIGLTTAVCLAEAGLSVQVHTAAAPVSTTSAVAGALWMPYLAEPLDRVAAWGRRTLTELRGLAASATTGVHLTSGVLATREPEPERPPWGELVDIRACPPADVPAGYAAGWRFTTPLLEMPTYLAYLTDRLAEAGGRIEQRPVDSLDQAATRAPVVVNCPGVAARQLVPDPTVRPVRGQVVVVENPGLTEFFTEVPTGTELCYALPHRDTVVLGGTAEPDQWDRQPRPEVARRIIARCAEVVPALAGARVLAHRVGLRPTRPVVRVEEEIRDRVRVIHNYGHGGAGVTLSWGCGYDVLARYDRERSEEGQR